MKTISDKTYWKFVKDLAKDLAKELEGITPATAEELVSTEKAAKIRGVTPNTMRKNKDKFPHIKVGDKKQSKLLFLKSGLTKYDSREI